MDVCYYTNQIKEELDGACDYMKRSLASKNENPDRASKYSRMADMELDHASSLIKMFEEDLREARSEDPIYEQVHQSIVDMYSEGVAKVRMMMNF